ncbi:L,D-transpeptidase family protein [Clostridium cavendishii]|nr:L,D-transpeptidase family protein [Clostridium cavendishii]
MAAQKNYIIFIDINELTLSLVDKETNKFEKTYPIAIGKLETPSPMGQFKIANKAIRKEPQFGNYWLGLSVPWDTFGIHGTSRPGSIGTMGSNGCIRMSNGHIKEVFSLVNINTSVIIYSGPNWLFSPYVRTIKPNCKGADVYGVQNRLTALGYYNGPIDGIYNYKLELAISKYRKNNNFNDGNTIDEKLLNHMGIIKFE